MPNAAPVVLGIAGIGGYAGSIAEIVLQHGHEVSPRVRFMAACDPELERHPARVAHLRERGVQVLRTYDELLAHPDIEAVWLPLPIQLHRPFFEQAMAAGKAVMVEKPAAGIVDDVDAMIAARDRAGLPAAVGFQDVYDPTTLPMKRRLLDGELGRITHATLHACWPRSSAYFSRSGWAGRMRVGDTWVLDSPANNALAHFIHIALFLMGPSLYAAADPVKVEAELYRAADIENYDTISLRITLEGGSTLLVLLTHACTATIHPITVFHGERGSMTRLLGRFEVRTPDAAAPQIVPRNDAMRRHMLERFGRLVRGQDDPNVAVATLEMARKHTIAMGGATEATPVFEAPADAVDAVPTPDGGVIRAIRGIERVFGECAARNQMLHESGLLPFTRPSGRCNLVGYDRFRGPAGQTPQHAATA